MSDRDTAIMNKACCYILALIFMAVVCALHLMGSQVAFEGGVFGGIFTFIVAELLIVIPKAPDPARREP